METETSAGPAEGQNVDGQTGGATSATDKPLSMTQAEFNRQLDERVMRERAKYADYKDIKAKADKLDSIEQASKSEAERALDRVTKAEAEVAQLPARVAAALRTHLVALHAIDADDAELFLTATEPELLLKQVQRLTGREADRKKSNNVVPREGTTSSNAAAGDEREFARALFTRDG